MVDTTEAMESQYLTAELVKESPSKRAHIIDEGAYEEVVFDGVSSRRLTMKVEIDGKSKLWRPNKDSISNLRNAYGKDTAQWVGKDILLQVIRIQGKNSVLAMPTTPKEETVDKDADPSQGL